MTVLCEKDADSIAEIEAECFSRPWSRQSVLEAMTAGHIFVGESDGGFLYAYGGVFIVGGVGYIDNIAVRENYRRKGIGRRIVCELERICRENNAEFITLEVRKSNTAAVALYERQGFENMGERPDFYSSPRENAVIMTKELI